MEWLIVVIVAGLVFWWWLVRRKGNSPFWKAAARKPDLALIFFKVEKCWFVDELPSGVSMNDLVGPFRLYVPSIGRTIKVWGKHPDYLESQDRFLDGLKRDSTHGFLGR